MSVRVHVNRQQFDRLVQKVVTSQPVNAALDAATLEVKGQISIYPPQRKGSKYKRGQNKRSEKLGQSWTTAKRGTLSRIIGTAVSYAPYVQGEKQTQMHKDTGWKTAQDVVDANKPRVQQIMSAAIRKVI